MDNVFEFKPTQTIFLIGSLHHEFFSRIRKRMDMDYLCATIDCIKMTRSLMPVHRFGKSQKKNAKNISFQMVPKRKKN